MKLGTKKAIRQRNRYNNINMLEQKCDIGEM